MKFTSLALMLATTALIPLSVVAAEEGKTSATSVKPAAASKEVVQDFTIMKVGKDDIKNSEVLDTWKSLFPGGSAPDFNGFDENIRQNVLRGLVSERLIYNEAVNAGYDKDPEVKKRITSLAKQVIMQNFMENKAKTLISDDQLHASYTEKVNAAKGQEEIKARHILLAKEEEAQKLYSQIQKGASFEKLAKERSTDKGSSVNGGELGWFTKDRMVPKFAEAAFKLKPGEVSEPVKTEFGWHIIKLEDRRPLQVASFEDMKESLQGELANKAMQKYVEGLLKTADIKYYSMDGKEKPFNALLSPSAKGGEKSSETDDKQDDNQ